MSPFEIDECLKSMTILVDSRERPTGKQSERRYKQFECSWQRATLDYGDYTYNFILPTGFPLFANSGRIQPDVVIERKMSLDELAGNFCERLKDSPDARAWNLSHKDRQIRNRFEYEFIKAQENHAKVYLLVEDATYENLYTGKYRTKMNKKSFVGSLWSFCARYQITPVFCKSETSGKIIHDILYYELRKRLESGAYG